MNSTQKPHPVDVAFSRLVTEDPRAGYYEALREAEERGARIVLDAIADTGFFGITGEYGDYARRDTLIRRILRAADGEREKP